MMGSGLRQGWIPLCVAPLVKSRVGSHIVMEDMERDSNPKKSDVKRSEIEEEIRLPCVSRVSASYHPRLGTTIAW